MTCSIGFQYQLTKKLFHFYGVVSEKTVYANSDEAINEVHTAYFNITFLLNLFDCEPNSSASCVKSEIQVKYGCTVFAISCS